MTTEELTREKRYVTQRISDGRVTVKKYHTHRNCGELTSLETAVWVNGDEDTGVRVNEVITLTERESQLLGLTECRQCETCRTGGPAVETIADFLASNMAQESFVSTGATEYARNLVAILGVNGFYIAKRS